MSELEHVEGQLDIDGKPAPEPRPPHVNPKFVQIEIEANYDLDASECWPDGEPEKWDATDVAEIVKSYSSFHQFVEEWLLDGFDVTIRTGHTSVTVTLR